MSKDITIVCCYNRKEEFEELCNEIKLQDINCEIIGLDNSNNKYKSCANAYNYATKKINTKYVLYSHQDIVLVSKETVRKLVEYIKCINTFDILGVAGVYGREKMFITSNIRTLDGSVYACPEPLKEKLQEVQTVDECIFGGHTECFKKYPFNDVVCNNYHLYAAEVCLQAVYRGNKVYVCDIDLIHKSTGNADKKFIDNFYRLCVFYNGKIDYITTTNAKSSTKPIKREISYLNYLFKKSELFKRIKNTSFYEFFRDEYKLKKFKKNWKSSNQNNSTIPVNLFNSNLVRVGSDSIGELNILNNSRNQLIIGTNVIIGKNVAFLLGVEHNINTISSYPFKSKILECAVPEAKSKGNIVVDNDVVIEDKTIILSNVHIGNNVKVMKGSVVTKDIPDNTIVYGAPALPID